MNPFKQTAEENKREANHWAVARVIVGIILILTILFL